MTYNVFGGTLSFTQSINQPVQGALVGGRFFRTPFSTRNTSFTDNLSGQSTALVPCIGIDDHQNHNRWYSDITGHLPSSLHRFRDGGLLVEFSQSTGSETF